MPTTANASKPTARERLLAAADEMFYSEGVQTVGVDRVVKKAGVAKASLYNLFGSKEELVRALPGRSHRRYPRAGRAHPDAIPHAP